MKEKSLPFFIRKILVWVICMVALTAVNHAVAADRYCRNTGLWNNKNTWAATSNGTSGVSVPGAGDTVYLECGRSVTIDTGFNAVCSALIIGTNNPGGANLVFCLYSSLTVSGNVWVGGPGGNDKNPAAGTIRLVKGSVMAIKGSVTLGVNDSTHCGSIIFTGGLLKIEGSFDVNFLGIFTPGSGTVEYCGGDQTVAPSNLLGTYNNLTLSGTGRKSTAMVMANGLISLEGSATVSDPISAGALATLQYKGHVSQITGPEFGELIGDPPVRTFSGAGGVIINNSNGVTLNSNASIITVLYLDSGDLNIESHLLTLLGKPIQSTAGNVKTTAGSSLGFISNAPDLYIPASVTALANLAVTSTSGVLLNGNIKCGTLKLIGKIKTGPHTLTVGNITGAPGPSNYIYGNLGHLFSPKALTFLFPVGDSIDYAPVQISFNAVEKTGEITVKTTKGKYSGLDKSGLKLPTVLKRYWTITNSGVGFKTYTAELTFVQGDLPAGSRSRALVVRSFDSGWKAPAIGSRKPLSIRTKKQTSFGDFMIGEGNPDLAHTTLLPLSGTLVANGKSRQMLTLSAFDINGLPLSGASVAIVKESGTGTVEEVKDHGDGTYTALLIAPAKPGSGVFGATIDGLHVKSGDSITLRSAFTYLKGIPSGLRSNLTLSGKPVSANDTITQKLMIIAMDASGNLVGTGGAQVAVSKISGLGNIGMTKDHGDGTYTIFITGRAASGSGVFSATINGEPVQGNSKETKTISIIF